MSQRYNWVNNDDSSFYLSEVPLMIIKLGQAEINDLEVGQNVKMNLMVVYSRIEQGCSMAYRYIERGLSSNRSRIVVKSKRKCC